MLLLGSYQSAHATQGAASPTSARVFAQEPGKMEMLPKVLTVFRFIIMLSVYACTTAVVCSVFTIQHPDGKELTPPLSPTMQCVLNLVFQYFLIYLLLWVFITVEDLSSGQINLHAAKDAIESAKSTVQFAPML